MNIYPIQIGTVHAKPAFYEGSAGIGIPQTLFRLLRQKPEVDFPIFSWLIEHSEGCIIIDTGDNASTGSIITGEIEVQAENELGPQLKRMGINPRDIELVLLTHLHTDHLGGIHHVRGCEIRVSDVDAGVLNTPLRRWFSKSINPIPNWLQPNSVGFTKTQFGAFSHSATITKRGDIVAVPTPGHTRGHMSIILIEDEKHIILAGDATFTEADLHQRHLRGVTMDVLQAINTIDTILDHAHQFPVVYLPSHDPESPTRLEKRQVIMLD